MSNQFTQGSWKATRVDSSAFNIRAGEDSIALVYAHQGSPVSMDRHDEGAANARLIAAAPALYEALKAVARNIDNDGVRCWCGKWRDHDASCRAATAALALVDQSTEAK